MGIIEAIVGILILFWVLGLFLHIAGGLIHILLVIAIVVFAMRFIRKSKNPPSA
jgi:hypothetical protein